MKPIIVDGKLEVKLYRFEVAMLQKAMDEIGQVLTETGHGDLGDPLVEAIAAVLAEIPPVSGVSQVDGDVTVT